MVETVELNLEPEARHFARPGEGTDLLGLLRVKFDANDPRLLAMLDLERQTRAKLGRGIILGWRIYRRYSDEEIDVAKVFHLIPQSRFQPTGEQCGTPL